MGIQLHTDVPEVPQTTVRTRTTDRDEFQVKIDKEFQALVVKTAQVKWPNAGTVKAPYDRYVVAKTDRGEIKDTIRRAGRLYVITKTNQLELKSKVDVSDRLCELAPVFYTDAPTGKDGLYQVKYNVTRVFPAETDPAPAADTKTDKE